MPGTTVDPAALLVESMRQAREDFAHLGEADFLEFDQSLVPHISFDRAPAND